ncbi:MAG: DUF924 family protein [Pseudomonadota bacterium]
MRAAAPERRPASALAGDILHFWFNELRPRDWFRRSVSIDAQIKDRFGAAHARAASADWPAMEASPDAALAYVLLLDQFSRNLYRAEAKAFACDARARGVAQRAIARRFDLVRPQRERAFFYLPFMHSETRSDQELSLRLHRTRLSSSAHLQHAQAHADIIAKFGRFPHRNAALRRLTTAAERQFLCNGGFSA